MRSKVLYGILMVYVFMMMGCRIELGDGGENPLPLVMISVPAGSFQRDDSASNVSTITNSFMMSKYEITRAQFLAVMGADPSDESVSSGMNDPVQGASWRHAIAFCNKLSIAEGLTPVYAVTGVDFSSLAFEDIPIDYSVPAWDSPACNLSNNGYRLPAVMEWMWACMGAPLDGRNGGIDRDGRWKNYAGHDLSGDYEIGEYAVFGYYEDPKENGETLTERTDPVGGKRPNEIGLYDMSGNVMEWMNDWFTNVIGSGTLVDYTGPASGTERAIRGGSWDRDWSYCGPRDYYALAPNYEDDGVGFRVMRR